MKKPGKNWKPLYCETCAELVGYYNPMEISRGAIWLVRCSGHITGKPILREFVEKWALKISNAAAVTGEDSLSSQDARKIINAMLRELGHEVEEKEGGGE